MRGRLALAAAALLAGASPGQGSGAQGKAAPCLILHDWFGKSPAATPAYVREHFEFLESQPFDGLALYLRTPDLSLNVSGSVMSDTPLGAEKIAGVLQPVARLPWKTLLHNFAAVLSQHPPDVFDPWNVVVENFGALARAARDAGLEGVYFDNENYGTRWADYPSGVAYPQKSLRDYQVQARLRGKQLMQAMTAAFPEITVLSLHGPYISEPKAPSPLFPSWQRSNRLLGPFFAGFVEGAGTRARVVDGGELYHLRSPEEFRKSYEWRKRTIASDRVDCAYLPAELRAQWPTRVDVAFGILDQPFGGQAMDPAVLQASLTHALRQTDRYVWLYVEGPTLLAPSSQGGAPADWVAAVRQARADALRPSSK
jgi:hypothetical protein